MSSTPAPAPVSYAFAQAYANPPASSIRALMPYAMRPGTVSMAGGYPARELFDVTGLREADQAVTARLGEVLQYSDIEGQASLRRALAALSATRGIHCDPDRELAVTGGSQQALSLIARVMLQAGDTAIVESAAYTNTFNALRYTGATVRTVPSGVNGMDIDALETLVSEVKPKMVCVVASFSNPCGATLTLAQRRRLIDLAVAHQFLLVEDDPYGELRFEGEHIAPIAALADAQGRAWTAYVSSLSKTVAPGLRLGWMVVPAEIRRRCMAAKSADDMASPAWIQEIAAAYLNQGHYARHVPAIVAAYGKRCAALADALTQDLADEMAFERPQGGMFLWGRLTGEIDARQLLPYAIEHEIVYVPGHIFYSSPADADAYAMRLSFATMDEEKIRLGVSRLKLALAACREGVRRGVPSRIVLP